MLMLYLLVIFGSFFPSSSIGLAAICSEIMQTDQQQQQEENSKK